MSHSSLAESFLDYGGILIGDISEDSPLPPLIKKKVGASADTPQKMYEMILE